MKKKYWIVLWLALWAIFLGTGSGAEAAWNRKLSTSDGGIWQKRIPLKIVVDKTQLPQEEESVKLEMQSKRQPVDLTFTVVEADAVAEGWQLPLAGADVKEIRLVSEDGKEYLFEILNPQGDSQRVGKLQPGAKLIFPLEFQTMEDSGQFYVYFDNPKAWLLPDWWNPAGFRNGGFEEGTRMPTGWVFDSQDAEHRISWSENSPRSGKKCVEVVVEKGAKATWIAARHYHIPVIGGKKYRITGWVRGEEVEGRCGWYAHLGTPLKSIMISPMAYAGDGTFDWKCCTMEFTAPEEATQMSLGTVLRGTGRAWFDDVRVEVLEDGKLEKPLCSCEVMAVETFPLTLRYPSRTNRDGEASFDAKRFFGTDSLPRYTFVSVTQDRNLEEERVVSCSSEVVQTRWRVEMDTDSVELLGLDGKPIPFEVWDKHFFFHARLPKQSVCHFLLVEKPTAVSRLEKVRQEVAGSEGMFPGTSLQGTENSRQTISGLQNAVLPEFLKTTNQVVNGGFEELDEQGNPIGWSHDVPSKTVTFHVLSQENEAVFGKNCVQTRTTPDAEVPWRGWRQTIPVDGGQNYLCGVWLKSEARAGDFSMFIHFHNEKKETIAMTGLGRGISGNCDWRLLSGNVQAPEDAAFMSLHLTIHNPGTVWYDNVFVSKFTKGDIREMLGGMDGIFQIPPIIKVFPDTTFSQNPASRERYAFQPVTMAKNEQESIQFALRFAKNQVCSVELSPATSADGQGTLPTELFAVSYVPVNYKTNYYRNVSYRWLRKVPNVKGASDGWCGYWPDPLIPLSPNQEGKNVPSVRKSWNDSLQVYTLGKEGFVWFQGEQTRALWLLVSTTKETPAGKYSGKITLRNMKKELVAEIPYTAEVLDFAIPDEPACGAIYDVRPKQMEFWNEKNVSKFREQVMDFMTQKRISPDKMPISVDLKYDAETGTATADWTEFDRVATQYFDVWKIPYAYLPGPFYCFGWGKPVYKMDGEAPYEGEYPYDGVDRSQLRPEYKKIYQAKLRAIWNHVKEKGWADRFVLYISDEPFYSMPEIIEQMKACCDMIHEVDPEIPIYSSTWRHVPQWDGYLDVWGVGHFGAVSEEQLQKSKDRGDRIWWTTDGHMCLDTPYCAIERLLPYWCVKYGADAYEFWGVSWFTYNPYDYGWHSFIHQSDRPGVEYYVLYPNADGYLLYPDKLLGTDRIISSVRLEQAREGVEEAAYLKRLHAEIERVSAYDQLSQQQKQTLENAKRTWTRAMDLVSIPSTGGRYSSRFLPYPEEVDEVKTLIGKWIVALEKIQYND